MKNKDLELIERALKEGVKGFAPKFIENHGLNDEFEFVGIKDKDHYDGVFYSSKIDKFITIM